MTTRRLSRPPAGIRRRREPPLRAATARVVACRVCLKRVRCPRGGRPAAYCSHRCRRRYYTAYYRKLCHETGRKPRIPCDQQVVTCRVCHVGLRCGTCGQVVAT